MVSVRALGIYASDPQRSHVALHTVREQVALPEKVESAGIGSCVDSAVLLTRKPTLPKRADLAGIVGPLKGRAAVVQLRGKGELRPTSSSPANLGPWRSRQFGCAVVGGPTGADQAGRLREALLGELPDFLNRSVRGHAEAEAFFFHVLKLLYDKGVAERGTPSVEDVRDAVLATVELTEGLPRVVVLATGHGIVQVSHETPSSLLSIEGLGVDVADELDPTLADSSLARERLRRFRAVLTLGGTTAPLEGVEMPEHVTARDLPQSSAVEVGRDFEPRVL